MVTLNRIVALATVHGPAAALVELDDAAREHWLRAARHTLSMPEQRHLLARATRGT